MTMSIYIEEAFDKIQFPLIRRTLNNIVVIEGTYLSIIKTIDGKCTTNIVVSDEKLQALTLGLGTFLKIQQNI